MMGGNRGGVRQPPPGNRRMMADPAIFNRTARLQKSRVGNIAFNAGAAGQFFELPTVGYHYRAHVFSDLRMTAVHAPAGDFRDGSNGGNTRFDAPHGLYRKIQYGLNVGNPIWSLDGYHTYLMGLVNNRGLNPWVQVSTGDTDRLGKELALAGIVDLTNGAVKKPGDSLGADVDYALRSAYTMYLTMGDAAAAGLIAVQDPRQRPQIVLDYGSISDAITVSADATAEPTGNSRMVIEYFTVPDPRIAPDTDFVMQTRGDQQQITGTGDVSYKAQIGGIFLKILFSIWNDDQSIAPGDLGDITVRVQQNQLLEVIDPVMRILEERRYYAKLLPDNAYCWDGTTGLGDPTMPSLRDRIASNTLTWLEFIHNFTGTVAAPADMRAVLQQLVPLPKGY